MVYGESFEFGPAVDVVDPRTPVHANISWDYFTDGVADFKLGMYGRRRLSYAIVTRTLSLLVRCRFSWGTTCCLYPSPTPSSFLLFISNIYQPPLQTLDNATQFHGLASQRLALRSGTTATIINRGLRREGLVFHGGKTS